jgi:hypothetical protein
MNGAKELATTGCAMIAKNVMSKGANHLTSRFVVSLAAH